MFNNFYFFRIIIYHINTTTINSCIRNIFTCSYIAQIELSAVLKEGQSTSDYTNRTSFVDVGYGDGTDKKNPGKAHELAVKEARSQRRPDLIDHRQVQMAEHLTFASELLDHRCCSGFESVLCAIGAQISVGQFEEPVAGSNGEEATFFQTMGVQFSQGRIRIQVDQLTEWYLPFRGLNPTATLARILYAELIAVCV